MECPNCSFQNTPGMRSCVRCQSRLDLAEVDFEPPRAGGAAALRGARARGRLWRYRAGETLDRLAARLRASVHPGINWAALLCSALPGGGQMCSGAQRAGAILLLCWCALLLLGLFSVGTARAWLFAAMALGLHSFAVGLVLARPLAAASLRLRLAVGMLVYVVLAGALYWPALRLAGGLVQVLPVQGVRDTESVARGDVFLCSGRWLRPELRRGDLVVYRIPAQGAGQVVIQSGQGVDRIIGLSGDRVEFDGERLLVNGEPVPEALQPVGGCGRIPHLSETVRDGCVMVFPSGLAWRTQGQAEAAVATMMKAASVVRLDDVDGRVWWRIRPWSRLGAVE
jgi:hypothetical protein